MSGIGAQTRDMGRLQGTIAIAAGASRGAGRGIAHVLGEAGATVYVAARTAQGVEETAAEVAARGGKGIPVAIDLSDEQQAAALFRRVDEEQGRLDVLANSARRMSKQGHGLIIHVTDNLHGEPSAHRGQILHDLGHECINRLILSTSRELKRSKVAVVGLNPGFMRTESVLQHMTSESRKKRFRFDLSETVEYIGRAAAALAADPEVIRMTGQLLWVADLAREYGFTDVDGRVVPVFDPKAPMQAYQC